MADDSQSRKMTPDDVRRMLAGIQMKDENKSADHKFWDTQPVPKLGAKFRSLLVLQYSTRISIHTHTHPLHPFDRARRECA